MKRSTSRALVAVLAAALALSGAVSVAAKDHPGKSGTHGAHAGVTKVGVVKTPSLTTKGNASHPGGVFRVLAIVKAAPADRPATVDAIVNFASGPATVVLTQSGGGSAYHANVPVPAAEPAGVVVINATAIVAGQTLTATGTGKIVIEDTTEAPAAPLAPASAPASAATLASPATCTSPSASESPEASDAAESPDTSEAPEASKAPEASDESSDNCDEGNAGSGLTADQIARLIAFIESLFS
jgi:hypothetical protein